MKRVSVLAAIWVLAVAVWIGALNARATYARERFDFVRWEIEALPGRWLYLAGAPLRRDEAPERALERYFALSDRSSGEAKQLENSVEATIEARITSVVREAGVGWPLPGTWPPVAMELASSPQVLVVSPRARIERVETESLRPDLSRADAERLERDAEAHNARSALVVPTGGVATYPAIVTTGDGYLETVMAAAHEWTHHYLALYPLGRRYFASREAETINETVADIVGEEIARGVIERYGQPAIVRPGATPRAARVDVNRVLRELRTEVDGMLREGRIIDAEQRMETVRGELERDGIRIRRINQAYFAWYGTYTARPDSVDPLGRQVRAARARAGSLGAFLASVREVRTRADVVRLAGE